MSAGLPANLSRAGNGNGHEAPRWLFWQCYAAPPLAVRSVSCPGGLAPFFFRFLHARKDGDACMPTEGVMLRAEL